MPRPTQSRTERAKPTPIIGPLLGENPGWVTTITDGYRTCRGAGRTPAEAERNAQRKWDRG